MWAMVSPSSIQGVFADLVLASPREPQNEASRTDLFVDDFGS